MDYVVNSSHILSLKKSGGEKIRTTVNGKRVVIGYTDVDHTPVNISVEDYIAQSNTWKSRHKGWKPTCMRFPEKYLPINPYFLGLWLGDGTSTGVAITTPDTEVIDYLDGYAHKLGLSMSTYAYANRCAAYAIVNPKNGHGSNSAQCLTGRLQEYGLINNKHIPHAFLQNSGKQSAELACRFD